METWQAKIVVLISMFVIAFLSGLASILLVDVIRRHRRYRRRRPRASSSDSDVTYRRGTGQQDADAASVDCGPVVSTVAMTGSGRHAVEKGSFSSMSSSTTSMTGGDVEEPALDVSGAVCGTITADAVIGLLNCFAGGVFLATSLLHLLPDARKDINKVIAASGRSPIEFPLAEFITCIGFFVVMLIEQLVLQCQRSRYPRHVIDDKTRLQQITASARHRSPLTSKTMTSRLDVIRLDNSNDVTGERRPMLNKATNVGDGKMAQPRQSCCHLADNDNRSAVASRRDSKHGDNGGNGWSSTVYGSIGAGDGSEVHSTLQVAGDRTSSTDTSAYSGDNGGNVSDQTEINQVIHSTRSFVLLLALSIHTVFEGLALGLQDSTAGLWTLFAAVALHKIIMAFTSGLRFAETLPTRRLAVVYVLIFAIMAPLGIGIGTAISESGGGGAAADVASALLQGLATGTFIYVTFFEVLNEQLAHEDPDIERNGCAESGLIKVLNVAIGFALVVVLEVFAEA